MTTIANLPALRSASAEIITACETAPNSQSPRPPYEIGYFGTLGWQFGVTNLSDWVSQLRQKSRNIPSI